MRFISLRSLQAQLALRLAAVFGVATLLGVCAVIYEGGQAAKTLGDDELERRAIQIARHVTRAPDGSARLELSPRLQTLYGSPARTRLFALRQLDGTLIAASDAQFTDEIRRRPPAESGRRAFHLDDFGTARQDYNGLSVRADSAVGPVWVSVAAVSDAEALARGLTEAFMVDVGCAIPLFAAGMLAVAVLSLRRGLRPVLAASEKASAIGPGATGVRLPTDGLPTELVPLVAAVNRALDRLELGFAVQRQFTANAAHELRTPLSILTAGLDELEDTPEITKLRSDAERMNRLVAQLLGVARLDSVSIEVNEKLDLRRVAQEVVEYLTPWALAQRRSLGFDAPAAPVRIRGHSHAIADAVRNLVENAVHHTREGTEVSIAVTAEGAIKVSDQGPGIDHSDRLHIFERFWRGRGARGPGAGLGLAIVSEIVKAHRGGIQVLDAPGGGTAFMMQFRLDTPDQASELGSRL
ncbi:MAG TPA: HAMP domain-containing sensor histidine kinase [Steroidobacteraceae bacterium]|nr:HAMP domain-containing sensor histidine kinase [Steroidobacteraceae bacterium]